MDRIEDMLMRVARIFGLAVMGLTLALAGIFVLVISYRAAASVFQQRHPEVKFYSGDFQNPNVQGATIEIPADDIDAHLSSTVLEEIVPAYRAFTESYINMKAEGLGLKDQADRQKALEDRVKAFRTSSDAALKQTLAAVEADEKKNFANGLVDYLEDAKQSGVEPYSDGATPIANIYYSAAFQKYFQKFNAQLAILKKQEEESVASIVARGSMYLGLAGCVLVFLLQAMMFAILRIEKKMKG